MLRGSEITHLLRAMRSGSVPTYILVQVTISDDAVLFALSTGELKYVPISLFVHLSYMKKKECTVALLIPLMFSGKVVVN